MYIYMLRARDAPTENVYIQYSSKPVYPYTMMKG